MFRVVLFIERFPFNSHACKLRPIWYTLGKRKTSPHLCVNLTAELWKCTWFAHESLSRSNFTFKLLPSTHFLFPLNPVKGHGGAGAYIRHSVDERQSSTFHRSQFKRGTNNLLPKPGIWNSQIKWKEYFGQCRRRLEYKVCPGPFLLQGSSPQHNSTMAPYIFRLSFK